MSLMGLCKNVLRLPLVTVNEKVQQDIENDNIKTIRNDK